MQNRHRKIPVTMGTQHPDNAGVPYWNKKSDGFISAHEELLEAVTAYRDLGLDEYMWDWEGKHADEAVIDKALTAHHDFYQKNQIGRDIFLTFRVPNVWHEPGHSLARALMVILTSEDVAHDLGFKKRPLFEIILPMTEKAEQLIYLQTAFQKLARFKNKTFYHRRVPNTDYVEIIPLVESVAGQMDILRLLVDYRRQHLVRFKKDLPYIRPFLARSDPALISGLFATIIAGKIALSEIAQFSKQTKIATYPIIGVGSLVFRGGLSPGSIGQFAKQYAGVRTVTIQSAFRYDYPLPQVKRALRDLQRLLPLQKAMRLSKDEVAMAKNLAVRAEALYQSAIEPLIPSLAPIFAAVPRRRERRLHVGLLSYGRKLGKASLPRAINFTAACYSLGIPPEFLGAGRFWATLSPAERALFKKLYPNLKNDLDAAGRFVALENIVALAKCEPLWQGVWQDIETITKELNINMTSRTKNEKKHVVLARQALRNLKNKNKLTKLIITSGKLRRSLG